MIRNTKQTFYITYLLLFLCLAATPRLLQSQRKILAIPEGFSLKNPPQKTGALTFNTTKKWSGTSGICYGVHQPI